MLGVIEFNRLDQGALIWANPELAVRDARSTCCSSLPIAHSEAPLECRVPEPNSMIWDSTRLSMMRFTTSIPARSMSRISAFTRDERYAYPIEQGIATINPPAVVSKL